MQLNEKKNTPLHTAVLDGDEDATERLLSAGEININARDKNGNSALYLATKAKKVTLVQKLLTAKGIDVDAKNTEGETPLILATLSGYLEIKRMLSDAGAADMGASPACEQRKKTEEPLSDIEQQVNDRLFQSIKKGNLSEIRNLISHGFEMVVPHYRMPLPEEYQFSKVINHPNRSNGRALLHEAVTMADRGQATDVTELFLKVPSINVHAKDDLGNTALHAAVAIFPRVPILRSLLDHGAHIDIKNAACIDALSLAIITCIWFYGYYWEPEVNLLLQELAITYREENRLDRLLEIFIDAKLDWDSRSIGKEIKEKVFLSLLYFAVYYSNIALIKNLLEKDLVDINQKDKNRGVSALLFAIKRDQYDAANILLTNANIRVDLSILSEALDKYITETPTETMIRGTETIVKLVDCLGSFDWKRQDLENFYQSLSKLKKLKPRDEYVKEMLAELLKRIEPKLLAIGLNGPVQESVPETNSTHENTGLGKRETQLDEHARPNPRRRRKRAVNLQEGYYPELIQGVSSGSLPLFFHKNYSSRLGADDRLAQASLLEGNRSAGYSSHNNTATVEGGFVAFKWICHHLGLCDFVKRMNQAEQVLERGVDNSVNHSLFRQENSLDNSSQQTLGLPYKP